MIKKEILLSVTDFDFVTDNGEQIKGSNLYVLGPKLNNDNVRGHRVAKYFIPSQLSQQISVLPCKAEVEYETDIKSDGTPSLKVKSIKYLDEVKLNV